MLGLLSPECQFLIKGWQHEYDTPGEEASIVTLGYLISLTSRLQLSHVSALGCFNEVHEL